LYQSAFCRFSQFGFVIFWRKNIGEKGAHKMLMIQGSYVLRKCREYIKTTNKGGPQF